MSNLNDFLGHSKEYKLLPIPANTVKQVAHSATHASMPVAVDPGKCWFVIPADCKVVKITEHGASGATYLTVTTDGTAPNAASTTAIRQRNLNNTGDTLELKVNGGETIRMSVAETNNFADASTFGPITYYFQFYGDAY